VYLDRWLSKQRKVSRDAEAALREMTSCNGVDGWRLVASRPRGNPMEPPPGIGEYDEQIENLWDQSVKCEAIFADLRICRTTFYARKRLLGLYRPRSKRRRVQ
jgi:hypothetical protein